MELPEISGRFKDHIVSQTLFTSEKLLSNSKWQHATHNHRLDPPVSAPQHNLGLLGVLVHLLGDAVNSKLLPIAVPLLC